MICIGENCVEHTPPITYFPRPRFIEELRIQPADGIKALSVNRFESEEKEKERETKREGSSPSFPEIADGRGKNFIKIPLVRGSSMRVFPSVKAQLWDRRRRQRVTQSPLFFPPSLPVLSARSLHLIHQLKCDNARSA